LENTKQLTKHYPSIIFLLSELWIYCAPLTWQEQESLERQAHFAALLEALGFSSASVVSLDLNNYLFAGLTGRYTGSQNS